VVLLAFAPLVTGCSGAAAGMTPSASTTTAIEGWEHYFSLDWAAQPTPKGHAIDGYVHNKYGTAAVSVQILAQGLDASGNVVGQKLAWVPGSVPPFNRAFFIVPGLPPAERYRVSVWAFDFVEGTDSDRR
jgi:hypothetical protein